MSGSVSSDFVSVESFSKDDQLFLLLFSEKKKKKKGYHDELDPQGHSRVAPNQLCFLYTYRNSHG